MLCPLLKALPQLFIASAIVGLCFLSHRSFWESIAFLLRHSQIKPSTWYSRLFNCLVPACLFRLVSQHLKLMLPVFECIMDSNSSVALMLSGMLFHFCLISSHASNKTSSDTSPVRSLPRLPSPGWVPPSFSSSAFYHSIYLCSFAVRWGHVWYHHVTFLHSTLSGTREVPRKCWRKKICRSF